jgi:MFS family permease
MIRMAWIVYLLIVVSFLDLFVPLPVISPYAQQLGAGPVAIGFVIGAYSLANLLGNVMAGKWIDRHGANGVLVIGMAASAFFLALYSLAQKPFDLIIVRLLHGFAAGLLVPSAFTLASWRAKRGEQGRNMAVSGAAVGVAAVIGPALGGILRARLGYDAVFWFVAALMLVSAFLCWAIFSRAAQAGREPKKKEMVRRIPDKVDWAKLFRNPYVTQACLGAFGLTYSIGVLSYMLPLKTEWLGLNRSAAGLLMSTFGLVAILIFLLPTNRLFDRMDPLKTMLSGMAVIAVSELGLAYLAQMVPLFVAMGVYGIGFGFLFPSMTKLLVEHVPDSDRGKAFGLFYAFYSIGVMIGSFMIGLVAHTPQAAFMWAAGVMMLLGCLILWQAQRKQKKRQNQVK